MKGTRAGDPPPAAHAILPPPTEPAAVPFVDSHAHLADPAFADDAAQVIARARAAGARAVICIGESPATARRGQALAAAHPGFIHFTAGLHPHEASEFDPLATPGHISALVAAGAVAIGECGLDYHYDNSPRPLQRRAFADQLALARDLARPVVVHTREAVEDTKTMIQEAGAAGVRGVLHCFTGPRHLAEAALSVGWYVSFSGIITFRRWDDDDLLRAVPPERLLAESDSPYLAPVPYRGKRNEPAWVPFTIARLASARGHTAESIGRLVALNAERLFGLGLPSASEPLL